MSCLVIIYGKFAKYFNINDNLRGYDAIAVNLDLFKCKHFSLSCFNGFEAINS